MKSYFFYYFPKESIDPVYSQDIPRYFDIEKEDFIELEEELNRSLSSLKHEFQVQGQEGWTNLTFYLESNGKMNIDYGYDNLSELSPVDKQSNWEEKYIKK